MSSDERQAKTTVELVDIPVALVHASDQDPDLLAALVAYDAHNWQIAKVQLEPIARTGNRLALFKYANTLDSLGDEVAAEHFWRIAVAGGDTNAGINLANLLKGQGRDDEVVGLYMKAIDDGSVDAMRNLGVFIEDDDPGGAEAWYLRAVEAGDAKSCANLALKHFNEGNVDEALKFAELGFDRGSMYAGSVIALHHVRREEWELALAAARRALTLSTPENLDDQKHPYRLIAFSLMQLLRFDESEQAIQDCVDRGDADVHELADGLKLMRDAFSDASDEPSGAKLNFCTNCGTKLQQGNMFCSNCGSKL